MLRGLRPVELVDVERKRIALDLLARRAPHRRPTRGTREAHRRSRSSRRAPPSPTSTASDPIGRRVDRRPHRRRDPVPERRSLRPLQRDRANRSIIRTARASPAQPAREPPAEPRVARRRDHPDLARHARPRLLPTQDRRRQDPQRSTPRPEATHQRRRLPPTPSPTPDPDIRGVREDNQGRLSIQRGRLNPEHRLFGKVTPGPTRPYAHRPATSTRPQTSP